MRSKPHRTTVLLMVLSAASIGGALARFGWVGCALVFLAAICGWGIGMSAFAIYLDSEVLSFQRMKSGDLRYEFQDDLVPDELGLSIADFARMLDEVRPGAGAQVLDMAGLEYAEPTADLLHDYPRKARTSS